MTDYSNMTEEEILAEQARSRAKREADKAGELSPAQVRKIADDMDEWEGREPYGRDDIDEILAGMEEDDE